MRWNTTWAAIAKFARNCVAMDKKSKLCHPASCKLFAGRKFEQLHIPVKSAKQIWNTTWTAIAKFARNCVAMDKKSKLCHPASCKLFA